ncbi:MAG: Glyoxalase/bleomycin resistance protein/dioxygenase, partial [Bryobacterales bacterium]|nr:Glyoxalase/bleomycin resistance protein/dioxygenase [Bryobacterales bacterium]
MNMKTLLFAAVMTGTVFSALAPAQQPKRPRFIGISQIVVRAHDLNESRHFYGDLLGFQEAITVRKNQSAALEGGLPPQQVSSVFFKVNNRQYIVVMPESSPDEPRFVRYAVETDDAEGARAYFKALGYAVPAKTDKTATGDIAFQMADADGNAIEIMQYTPASLSVQSFGKYLAKDRLAQRIIHAGFGISKPESVKLYLEGFAVREFWRSDPTMKAPGAAPAAANATAPTGPLLASLSNLKLPESDDYIEWSISRTATTANAGAARGGQGHIALLTP